MTTQQTDIEKTLKRILARILGITTNAISNWSDEKNIPPGREWQLKAIRPEWFAEQKTKGNP